MSKTEIVVLAAGMGSRFGGLKQIAPLGPNGEIIIDYSIYDAVKAGFSKAVFIIKKEIEKDFREAVGKRIEKLIDTEYVFQEIDDLPAGFSVPEGRTKPWGTAHAILCARNAIKNPFAIVNADDFYGASSFKTMNDYLSVNQSLCMVGYKLGNTLTDNGTVCRGVCEVENGYLTSVTEHTNLDKNSGLPLDTVVSMNMWGFNPSVFDEIEEGFIKFLKNLDNPLKGEYFIPLIVDSLIKEKGQKCRVLDTDEKWYGVTYKEDSDSVKAAIKAMTENGLYKF